MSNKPLAPTQLPFNPTPDYNPEAQSNIPSPNAAPAQGVASLYGSTPQTRGNDTASGIMNAYQSQKQQEPQDGSQATLFGGRDLQAPPFQGGGNPSFQNMMQGAEFARPDVMPRGLGPSVVMDENGLEPRRGPR
jgi:hypothetical protein